MSEQDPISPPPSTSLSASQPLDQSLVRVFGALERVLTDLTTSSQSNQALLVSLVKAINELTKRVSDRGKIDDQQREAVLSALLKLTEKFDKLPAETRQALAEAQEQIGKRLKEITGEHPLLPNDPEGAPRFLQVVILHLTNFGWKNKAKVAGWVVIASSSAWTVLEKIAPIVRHWFHHQ